MEPLYDPYQVKNLAEDTQRSEKFTNAQPPSPSSSTPNKDPRQFGLKENIQEVGDAIVWWWYRYFITVLLLYLSY